MPSYAPVLEATLAGNWCPEENPFLESSFSCPKGPWKVRATVSEVSQEGHLLIDLGLTEACGFRSFQKSDRLVDSPRAL